MIDHTSLPVANLARSRAFYDRCLGALGYKVVMNVTDSPDVGACGHGSAERTA
jgi:catechol 2,3-dioxygenase-like lactoylglutathione lyase family enzyme